MIIRKEKFDKIEKEFLAQLLKIHNDIQDSIKILREKKYQLIKSELCLAFIGADTFSRFYKIFKGSREDELYRNIKERFESWLNDFVFIDENEVYKSHKDEINCDVSIAWELRNSLIHFYGLPNPEQTGKPIGFLNANFEQIKKFEGEFERRGKEIKFINPCWLILAILHGLLTQLEHMKAMIRNKPNEYISAVLLAHKIVMSEGTSFVDTGGSIQRNTTD